MKRLEAALITSAVRAGMQIHQAKAGGSCADQREVNYREVVRKTSPETFQSPIELPAPRACIVAPYHDDQEG